MLSLFFLVCFSQKKVTNNTVQTDSFYVINTDLGNIYFVLFNDTPKHKTNFIMQLKNPNRKEENRSDILYKNNNHLDFDANFTGPGNSYLNSAGKIIMGDLTNEKSKKVPSFGQIWTSEYHYEKGIYREDEDNLQILLTNEIPKNSGGTNEGANTCFGEVVSGYDILLKYKYLNGWTVGKVNSIKKISRNDIPFDNTQREIYIANNPNYSAYFDEISKENTKSITNKAGAKNTKTKTAITNNSTTKNNKTVTNNQSIASSKTKTTNSKTNREEELEARIKELESEKRSFTNTFKIGDRVCTDGHWNTYISGEGYCTVVGKITSVSSDQYTVEILYLTNGCNNEYFAGIYENGNVMKVETGKFFTFYYRDTWRFKCVDFN